MTYRRRLSGRPHSASIIRSRASVRRALEANGRLVVLPSLGGSLPLYLLRQELGAPNVSVSLWNHDNNQHAEDENIRLGHLWDGIAAVAAIMTMDAPREGR